MKVQYVPTRVQGGKVKNPGLLKLEKAERGCSVVLPVPLLPRWW